LAKKVVWRSVDGMLKEGFSKLEARLLAEVKDVYRERLLALVVFGSVARRTQRFDSDLDVLLIVDHLPPGRMKRMREFGTVETRLAETLAALRADGINSEISPLIKSPREIEAGSPLLPDMVEDAVPLYDRNGFFAGVMERLGKRLSALGAKRVWRGSAWYWDLKPDYKPGEVFEI